MPGRNGMGPMGQGPRTGGGRGWCDGTAPRVDMAARGPVIGMGRGNAAATEQELAVLKQQATGLEQALGELKSRIQELDKSAPQAPEKEHE